MKNTALSGALLVLGALASGCAPYYTPYGIAPFSYPSPRSNGTYGADPEVSARGRWDNVMRLPAGSEIEVLTWEHGSSVGAFSWANGYSVRMLVGGAAQETRREDILRVDLRHLPGSGTGAAARQTAVGALTGIGFTALVSAVIGGSAWPPPGTAVRGAAAIGGLTAAQVESYNRRPRPIYIAEDMRQRPGQSAEWRRPLPGPQATAPMASYSVRAWDDVMRLPPNTPVAVWTSGGVRHAGALIAAEDLLIRLRFRGAELRVSRSDVSRVEVFSDVAGEGRDPAVRD